MAIFIITTQSRMPGLLLAASLSFDRVRNRRERNKIDLYLCGN
ncbi:hypothetical protein ASZ90_007788 [hydrocarbon metagenome]|uniref:Uncharacterized protein n=1 Tax=hydrocarbon metagenome TaxID=938273 RepID=A0A0W8FNS8_9ZZZZ